MTWTMAAWQSEGDRGVRRARRVLYRALAGAILLGLAKLPASEYVQEIRCAPATAETKSRRLQATDSYALVELLDEAGRQGTLVVFTGADGIRTMLRTMLPQVLSTHAGEKPFSKVEIQKLTSGPLVLSGSLSRISSDSSNCVIGGLVERKSLRAWSRSRALEEILKRETRTLKGGRFVFKGAPRLACQQMAELLTCNVLLTRDDYSGTLMVTLP